MAVIPGNLGATLDLLSGCHAEKSRRWYFLVSWLQARVYQRQSPVNQRPSETRWKIYKNILLLLNNVFDGLLQVRIQTVKSKNISNLVERVLQWARHRFSTRIRGHRARILRASSGFLRAKLWLVDNFYVTEIVLQLELADVPFRGRETTAGNMSAFAG